MDRVTTLHVNGAPHPIDAAADRPLLDTLREDLGLTGCKIACGEGACGACTVLVGGQPTRACITPTGTVGSRPVRTVEGLARDGRLHPLQQAFVELDALQCGYCTPGMIMSALGLLEQSPAPSEEAVVRFMDGNICRCGAYARILRAIQAAAAQMRAESTGGAP
jgi:aerobic-type carbon monoxide dehydrogenase small subunit (CoxS/CutS family)